MFGCGFGFCFDCFFLRVTRVVVHLLVVCDSLYLYYYFDCYLLGLDLGWWLNGLLV